MSTNHPLELVQTIMGEDMVQAPRINRQLFENSPLSGSAIDADYRENPDALYGDKDPNLAILHEQPWHRAVMYMMIRGETRTAIAEKFGKTVSWISQLTRQPWFKDRMTRELSEAGGNMVETLLQSEVVPSLEKVIELRDKSQDQRVQLSAATQILDRFLGKPTQKVESTNVNLNKEIKDVGDIDRELAMVQSQLATALGTKNN